MDINNNNLEEDASDEDKSEKSKTVKTFGAILKYIKNIESTIVPLTVKS